MPSSENEPAIRASSAGVDVVFQAGDGVLLVAVVVHDVHVGGADDAAAAAGVPFSDDAFLALAAAFFVFAAHDGAVAHGPVVVVGAHAAAAVVGAVAVEVAFAGALLGGEGVVARGVAEGGGLGGAEEAREEGGEGLFEHGEAGADGAGVGFDDGPDGGGDVAPGGVVGGGGRGERGGADDGGRAHEDAEGEDREQAALLAPGELQLDDFVDGEDQDEYVQQDVDERVREPEGFAAEAAGAGDRRQQRFVPEGGDRCALPDRDQREGRGRGGDEADEDPAHPAEFLVREDAQVEEEDGFFVEADADFVDDLRTVKPLEAERVLSSVMHLSAAGKSEGLLTLNASIISGWERSDECFP